MIHTAGTGLAGMGCVRWCSASRQSSAEPDIIGVNLTGWQADSIGLVAPVVVLTLERFI